MPNCLCISDKFYLHQHFWGGEIRAISCNLMRKRAKLFKHRGRKSVQTVWVSQSSRGNQICIQMQVKDPSVETALNNNHTRYRVNKKRRDHQQCQPSVRASPHPQQIRLWEAIELHLSSCILSSTIPTNNRHTHTQSWRGAAAYTYPFHITTHFLSLTQRGVFSSLLSLLSRYSLISRTRV